MGKEEHSAALSTKDNNGVKGLWILCIICAGTFLLVLICCLSLRLRDKRARRRRAKKRQYKDIPSVLEFFEGDWNLPPQLPLPTASSASTQTGYQQLKTPNARYSLSGLDFLRIRDTCGPDQASVRLSDGFYESTIYINGHPADYFLCFLQFNDKVCCGWGKWRSGASMMLQGYYLDAGKVAITGIEFGAAAMLKIKAIRELRCLSVENGESLAGLMFSIDSQKTSSKCTVQMKHVKEEDIDFHKSNPCELLKEITVSHHSVGSDQTIPVDTEWDSITDSNISYVRSAECCRRGCGSPHTEAGDAAGESDSEAEGDESGVHPIEIFSLVEQEHIEDSIAAASRHGQAWEHAANAAEARTSNVELCIICAESPIETVLLPCHHESMCKACCARMLCVQTKQKEGTSFCRTFRLQCPICRGRIQAVQLSASCIV